MPTDNGGMEKKGIKPFLSRARRFLNCFTDKLTEGKNEKKVRTLLLFLTAALLALLIVPDQHFVTSRFNAGDIASTDFRATQRYILQDELLTEKKRSAATASVPLVYNFYPNRAKELTGRFEQALSLVPEAKNRDSAETRDKLLRSVAEALGCGITSPELDAFERVGSKEIVLSEIGRILNYVYERKVVADNKLFSADRSHGIIIIDTESGKIADRSGPDPSAMDVGDAGKIVRKAKIRGSGGYRNTEIIKGVLVKALQPNLVFDRDATEKKKSEAASAVRPVFFQVERGEMIDR